MGAVHGDLFADIYNRMLDWIPESNEDSNVSNLSLDYLNEAQKELRFEALWTELLIIEALTISSKVATLGNSVGEICSLYTADSNMKPSMFYFNKSQFSTDGYREVNSGDKDAGYTRQLQFYVDPADTVYLNYYKTLDDFAASGTQYSWFPGRLLFSKAKLLYLEDEGLESTNDYVKIQLAFERSLTNFKRGHQYVNMDMRMVLRDNLGYLITFGAYNLADGEEDKMFDEAYGNSIDLKGYSHYAI